MNITPEKLRGIASLEEMADRAATACDYRNAAETIEYERKRANLLEAALDCMNKENQRLCDTINNWEIMYKEETNGHRKE